MRLDGFMSSSNIPSARALSLGVIVGNSEGSDTDYWVAVVVVDCFSAGV